MPMFRIYLFVEAKNADEAYEDFKENMSDSSDFSVEEVET